MSIDINLGSHFDITKPHILKRIKGWIKGGCVNFVWIGTPCSSWSRARRGPPNSSWCTIRSKQFLQGLPNLRPADQSKIDSGNKTAAISSEIISLCILLGVPCCIENPATSLLFESRYLKPKLADACCTTCKLDFCGYKARWRKRTLLAAWHFPEIQEACRLCHSSNHICSFSGKPHIILTGADPSSGRLWTAVAEPYPKPLCTKLAGLIHDRIDTVQHSRIARLLI